MWVLMVLAMERDVKATIFCEPGSDLEDPGARKWILAVANQIHINVDHAERLSVLHE